MNRTAFIINPHSARGNYQPFLKALLSRHPDAKVYLSETPKGTADFISASFHDVDIFVAVGGDGTISSVARQLINTGKILGIFPAGSGNGFSNETKFSKNLNELLSKIKKGQFREIDTMKINGHVSVNVSGTGFDGAVVRAFEQTGRGFRNYIKTSIQTFFSYKPVQVGFIAEEYRSYEGKYLMVNVANTRQFGNNAYIAPHADTTDGLAEIVLVRKFPLWHSAEFACRLFAGKLKENTYIKYLSVREIQLEIDTVDWHIDGEYVQIKSPVHIIVLPRSLRILI